MFYNRLVSVACGGALAWDFIKWHLPPEEGWSIIHAHQISEGAQMEWRH